MHDEIEGLLDERPLIQLMPRRRAFRRTRAARSTDVAERAAVANQLLEIRPHELPRADVLGLFLQPHDVANGRITAENFLERESREWVELLDAADGDVACSRASLV